LEVFDANGIRNFSTSQKIQPSGNKIMIDWDGLSNNGGLLLPGKYYYRITVTQNGLVEQLINSLLKF
jgi:flagellar hook assembly protein FlgD